MVEVTDEVTALLDAYAALVWRVCARLGVSAERVEETVIAVFVSVARGSLPTEADARRRLVLQHAVTHAKSGEGPPLRGLGELNAALQPLSPDTRAAVVLADLEGLTPHEVSKVQGVPVGSVDLRLRQGRAALAQRLAPDVPVPVSDELQPAAPAVLAFLRANGDVGAPTPAQLRRIEEGVRAALAVPVPRRWNKWRVASFIGGVLALGAAAVVARSEQPPDVDTLLSAAWASGSRQAVVDLGNRCETATCRTRAQGMTEALSLAERLERLRGADLVRLARLDYELSEPGKSPFRDAISKRQREVAAADAALARREAELAKQAGEALRNPPPSAPEPGSAYLAQFNALRRAGKFEDALAVTQRCIDEAPELYVCWRWRGWVLNAMGVRDKSDALNQQAYEAYLRFVSTAPSDDPAISQVLELISGRYVVDVPPLTGTSRVSVKRGDIPIYELSKSLQGATVDNPEVLSVYGSGRRTLYLRGKTRGTATVQLQFSDGLSATWVVTVR